MKHKTIVIRYLQMCIKEYGCCPKFGRGDNSTKSFMQMGEVARVGRFFLVSHAHSSISYCHNCYNLTSSVHGAWNWDSASIMASLFSFWDTVLCTISYPYPHHFSFEYTTLLGNEDKSVISSSIIGCSILQRESSTVTLVETARRFFHNQFYIRSVRIAR